MSEKFYFEADAAIVTRLGRELVSKQETALIELIKNSFDADATEVSVVFSENFGSPYLEIRDNGSGMSRDDVLCGFLRLASDLKIRSPYSPKFKRQRAGRKGIGRFATHRLGDRLVLTTRRREDVTGLKLTVDWAGFTSGRALSEVPVILEDMSDLEPGTTLRMESLLDEWSDAQIRRCWRGVLSLQQPFPVAPIESKPDADPGFTVKFLREDQLFHDETVVADLQTEILDHLHAIVELKVDSAGASAWKISRNRFDEPFDWQPVYADGPDARVSSCVHLKNIWMKAYYVILDPSLLPALVFARVRDELASRGGIRLYRNGFRVVPYGDPDNDWLRLDETYAKRSILVPTANRNFFGVVEVQDVDGILFEEHTSREGLIETPAFLELKDLVSTVLITAATRIAASRGRKTKAGAKPRHSTGSSDNLERLKAAVLATKSAAEKVGNLSQLPSAPTENVLEVIQNAAAAAEIVVETQKGIEAAQAELADETSMLRFLATLGMTTAEFSHETGMTFDAFRLDFDRVLEIALEAEGGNPLFAAQATRARSMLSRLDTLTSYLNDLASARSARGMRAISLSKTIERFHAGIRQQAESQSVSLAIALPSYDPLFATPMHEAELASVLLNLYTNAVKALKRSGNVRRILIVGDRINGPKSRVRLRFCDSGDGIPDEYQERIFDPFFTTGVAPSGGAPDGDHARGTGLGLWIVHQIVSNAGGEVSLETPPAGFVTCFEIQLPAEDDDGQ
ncbi:sensor histidine kinase [Burkholderia sp. RF4-BP95]|uniref:sensor histidine kinase n=1 Tax=Burkholderia sp. RF4-BP95 TaxID=1637845 RepID=UPI0009EC4E8D|nr:sensor histidine kinase [Burkholderia sp. RF4-BP95]